MYYHAKLISCFYLIKEIQHAFLFNFYVNEELPKELLNETGHAMSISLLYIDVCIAKIADFLKYTF